MSADNKYLVSTHIQLAWNSGEYEKLKQTLSKNFFYKTTFTDEILNADQYIGLIALLRDSIPDISVKIDLIMAENDAVMTRVSFSGKVEKSIYGIPVSDKEITFSAMSIWEIDKNKIANTDTLIDMTGVSRQVGAEISPQIPLNIRSDDLLKEKGLKNFS